MFVDAEEDEIIAGAEEAMLCGEESKILAAFSWLIHNKRIPPMTLLGMARNEAYRRRPWSAYVKCSNLCLVFIMSMIHTWKMSCFVMFGSTEAVLEDCDYVGSSSRQCRPCKKLREKLEGRFGQSCFEMTP